MKPIEPDDRLDALLRDSMHGEAETVMPAGDGLARIQQRVSARRARSRWLRPAMALGSAALVSAVAVTAYAVVQHSNNDTDTVVPAHTSTPTASVTAPAPAPSQSSTPSQPFATVPRHALFPFTSLAGARVWEAQHPAGASRQPFTDPVQVATTWMSTVLKQPDVNQNMGATLQPSGDVATVQLGRTMTAESGKTVPVTDVHLVKYNDEWVVVGATDAGNLLKITTPTPGTTVTSPVTVSGPAFGVDEAAPVNVADAVSGSVFGTAHASWGNGTPWSTAVTFSTPTSTVGMIAVIEHSLADGGASRIAVEQVRFSTSAPSAAYPTYFYGIKNGQVAKMHASDGSAVAYISPAQPGGGASDPQLSPTGDRVYYLQGAGTCANALMVTRLTPPHATGQVAAPDAGYVITSYAATNKPANASGNQHEATALYETACDSARSPQAKLVLTDASGGVRTINFRSMPPGIVGNPAFEPGTPTAWAPKYLDAVVRTGTEAYLARYDVTRGTSPTPSRSACPGYDVSNGLPGAITTDADGIVWFAAQTGSSMQVWKCMAGGRTAIAAFSVAGNRTPGDISVDSGDVLVSDTNGNVWRWSGSGQPIPLSPAVPQPQLTW